MIATTNHAEKIGPALLRRPSRFDQVWQFPIPGRPERRRMIEKKGLGRFSGKAVLEAAEASAGFSGAHVQEAVLSAFLMALYERREPADGDLLAGVRRLKEQDGMSRRADGEIRPLQRVGFQRAGDGGEF